MLKVHRDPSASSNSKKVGSSVYIIQKPGAGTYTLGLAGREGAEGAFAARLGAHSRPADLSSSNVRHHHHPFTQVRLVVELTGWSAADVASAEKCLYRSCAVRFPFRCESVFDAAVDENFDDVVHELGQDLIAIEQTRSRVGL